MPTLVRQQTAIMSTIEPRHAVAFHFFNEEATRYGLYQGIRATYDGPLSLATDMMVWNGHSAPLSPHVGGIFQRRRYRHPARRMSSDRSAG